MADNGRTIIARQLLGLIGQSGGADFESILPALASRIVASGISISVAGVFTGFDADKLDGQDGSYYLNASNLASGTVPMARIALTNSSASLSGDVTIVSANTWTDGPTLSLAAGTWFVTGHAQITIDQAVATLCGVRISDGTSHYAQAGGWTDSIAIRPIHLTVSAVITLASPTTIKLQGVSDQGSSHTFLKAAVASNGAGNIATQICAVRIT